MTPGVDPFAELSDLFLTEPDGKGPSSQPRAASTTVELVLVGHLPVRANVWLSPYGDTVAREAGPAILLRLDGDCPRLAVLRAGEGRALPPAGSTLREAIADLAAVAAPWLVRPALDASPRELLESGCDRITVLSSADEVARVHAYARIKALAEAAERFGHRLPALGLAVLGADRPTAEGVGRKLAEAATANLGVSLPLVACLPRIDEHIHVTDCELAAGETGPSLRSVVAWIQDASVEVPEEPRPAPAETAAAAAVKIAPKPAAQLEGEAPAVAREPDVAGATVTLSQLIEGVRSLPVRCPGHERLELAVDQAGRLHVVAREADLRALHIVAAWARTHRELISLTSPHYIDPAVKVVCHVFTDEPSSLCDLHGTDLRLHVLAQVTVEGKRGWYAAPLNASVR